MSLVSKGVSKIGTLGYRRSFMNLGVENKPKLTLCKLGPCMLLCSQKNFVHTLVQMLLSGQAIIISVKLKPWQMICLGLTQVGLFGVHNSTFSMQHFILLKQTQ